MCILVAYHSQRSLVPHTFLPSVHKPGVPHLDEDPDDVGATIDTESDQSFSSVDFEEETSAGDEDTSPSPSVDLGASHPKAP